MKSQNELILEYLETHADIGKQEALMCASSDRLAARIKDLKREPYKKEIETIMVNVTCSNGRVARVARYRLVYGGWTMEEIGKARIA